MTPEQVALKAYRERNTVYESLCATAGQPLYEAHAHRPAEGCKCSISRSARVFQLPDGRVVMEGIEILHRRFARSGSSYKEAADASIGKSLADQYLARDYF
jgi:hypothetical protein